MTRSLPHFILLLLFFGSSNYLFANRLQELSNAELLLELDRTVSRKDTYREQFEDDLVPIKKKAFRGTSIQRKEAYIQLFHSYVHHQSDSAIAYLNRMETLPDSTMTADFRTFIAVGRAEVYGVMGLYKAAADILSKLTVKEVSSETRLYYYQVCRTVYGWMVDFGEIPEYENGFFQLTNSYRDSIMISQPAGVNRDIVLADKLIVEGEAQSVYDLCLQALAKADDVQRTYLYIILADAAKALNRKEDYVRYLALAAINDIRRGITEYKALPQLALALSEEGDVARAYEYLLCSMDDAYFCKARLRSFEASSIFPIIERAHEDKLRERRYIYYAIAVFTVLIILMLTFFIFFMRRQMEKLSQAREKLSEALASIQKTNEALKLANEELSTSHKVKETYIARYLQRCRGYIDTLSDFRRQLLKLAKGKQFDELTARLQGNEFVNDEERTFYADFDEAFVTLYPNFIDNFNALLIEEARTYPKRDEILNTELRVFALIRLGVTDSNRIAHFLNYSLPTIYSYRSRLRNKSLLSKSEFDLAVMQC